jgi:hypothetical protein
MRFSMHAVLVTFRPLASEDEFMEQIGPKMKATRSTEGLLMKTFLENDEGRWGGFYLFTDRDTAGAYLNGDFFTEFSSSPLLTDLSVQHWAVDDGPSQGFGTPSTPMRDLA